MARTTRRRPRPSAEFRSLLRKQLDAKLGPDSGLRSLERPTNGWIQTIRTALGMSAAQLANRLGISHQGVRDLEQGEAADKISIGTLTKVADALDCDLVFALVPRTSLEAAVQRQARAKAIDQRNRLVHTMRLEDQESGVAEALDIDRATAAWTTDRITKLWDSKSNA